MRWCFVNCTVHQIDWSDEIKEVEMELVAYVKCVQNLNPEL